MKRRTSDTNSVKKKDKKTKQDKLPLSDSSSWFYQTKNVEVNIKIDNSIV